MIPLLGSERNPVRGAREIGRVAPREKIQVTIVLRRNASAGVTSIEELGRTAPRKRVHLSREEFASKRGASSKDIQKVVRFASQNGLEVIESSASKRSVILCGTAHQLQDAFGVELKVYEHPKNETKFRGRAGPLYIPENLEGIIHAVLGLDNRPQTSPRFRPLPRDQRPLSTYAPPDIAKIYDYPAQLDGSGECIGIIELGGGYSETDLNSYFGSLGINAPKVVAVSVDGGANSPTGNPEGPDGEVMLDIEVAGSIAPGATIAMYFAPNTDQGFVDAVSAAANDAKNKPSVMSISWGSSEDTWTSQGIQSLNQALEDAASLGVTVCCAAGDDGSSDGEDDGLAHVDFPASSPYAVGCGGTKIVSVNQQSGVPSEVVWNDGAEGGATGGGVSDVFPLPSWQAKAGIPLSANPGGKAGRGVPDASGDASPLTGYTVRVDGETLILGGTSAVAPLIASLVALANQKLGHSVGYVNPQLYGIEADFHDITSGNNGAYVAGPGWDACTGLGSPDGTKILNALLS